MSIRIDRETGDIVGTTFVIRRGTQRGILRTVQPRSFRQQDAGVIRVAEAECVGYIVGVFAVDRIGGIEVYELLAYRRGDSWDNWTEEKEEVWRETYHAILTASGIGNDEALPWGHAKVVYDPKNLTDSLWVVHKPQHGASAP